ncbi:MAG: response regulator [Thermomicrobiales bacterium]
MSDDALILVVDDDARLRTLLSRYLAENGFRVTTAANAAEAREKMRFLKPELLVLDVMMPGENGLDLTEALRRDNRDLPVLLLTARGAPEDRIAGFEAGADDYLPKPFDPKELLLRIRALPAPRPAPAGQRGARRAAAAGRAGVRRRPRRVARPRGHRAPDRRRGRIAGRARAQAQRGAVTRGYRGGARHGRDRRAGDRRHGDAVAPQDRARSARAAFPAHRARAWICPEAGAVDSAMRLRVPLAERVKSLLPRSLLWRSLLIMLVPLVVVQVVALQVFYGTHLDIVSRRFASAVAGEIATTIDLLDRFPDPWDRGWILGNGWRQWEMQMRLEPGVHLPRGRRPTLPGQADEDLAAALRERVRRPFTMDWASDPLSVLVRVQLQDAVLEVEAPRKRLYTGTIYLFVIWLVGSALLLFGIAALFMRNQVRAIRRLASAAEAFGMGRDIGPIRPEGATEVRQAALAFNRMQERIRRFLQQRTEMLAGVSHDLRTPLTRLRLALAMLPAREDMADDVAEMNADVTEMERMIRGYLAFARGEGIEQARLIDLSDLLGEIAASARRGGTLVETDLPGPLLVRLRPDAMRRAVTNLIDNACRHASQVRLGVLPLGQRNVQVTVDDNGPGIPAGQRETVFRPFESGAAGGTGLGLTIARDIVRAHGGEITLEDSPLGGLRARVQIPM